MAAIDDLTNAINTLDATIARAVTELQAPKGTPDAAIEAAVQSVNQANATLSAALPPQA